MDEHQFSTVAAAIAHLQARGWTRASTGGDRRAITLTRNGSLAHILPPAGKSWARGMDVCAASCWVRYDLAPGDGTVDAPARDHLALPDRIWRCADELGLNGTFHASADGAIMRAIDMLDPTSPAGVRGDALARARRELDLSGFTRLRRGGLTRVVSAVPLED